VSLRDPDALLAEARAADAVPAQGPLHGLPVAIKDLAEAQGLPTTEGSPLFAGRLATRDDLMVARMRAAGAIVIGKTNTPAFGLGSHTTNPVFGATRNPYDPARTPGGSSGGAAAALAAGMIPIADGSDMMGSLRNPAGWCNVYGFRPSWGLVPGEPEGDTFLHQLSTLGPMGRSPADVALLLGVQAGPDPRQPHGVVPDDYSDLSANVAGRRIGWLGDWGGLPCEAGVLAHCAQALQTFDDLGCPVEVVAPPFPRAALWDSWTSLRSWAVAGGMGALCDDPASRDALNPQAIWEIEQGRRLTAADVHAASLIRSDWFRTAATLFDTYDALVLPTAQLWPFPVEWDWPRDIAGQAMDTYHRWMEVVIPASLAGLPTLAVPAGFGPAGLPMGLQLIGRRGDDLRILQLGQAWHMATGWPARHPPALTSIKAVGG
jgi:amidase